MPHSIYGSLSHIDIDIVICMCVSVKKQERSENSLFSHTIRAGTEKGGVLVCKLGKGEHLMAFIRVLKWYNK